MRDRGRARRLRRGRRSASGVGIGGLVLGGLLLGGLVAIALGGGGVQLPARSSAQAGQGAVELDGTGEGLRPQLRAVDPLPGAGVPGAVALAGTGWQAELGGVSVAATGDGELVVTGTDDGMVHALDADTGEHRWASDLGTSAAQLVLHETVVVVRHAGGRASVLDRGDGGLLWRRGPGLEEDRVLAVGAVDEVVLLALGLPDRPRLFAAGLRDGDRRWEQLLRDGWIADARGRVAPVGVVDGSLTGFDPTSGGVRWQLGLDPDERPIERIGELVLVRGSDGYLWVELATGQPAFRASRELGSWLRHPDEGLVLASAGGTSLLLSVDGTGMQRWERSLPRPGGRPACCIGLAATTSGEVLVTDRRGPEPIVRVLHRDDGRVVTDLSALETVDGRRVLTVTATTAVVVGPAGTLGVDRDTRTPRWRVPARTELLSTDPVLLAPVRGDGSRGTGATGSLLAPP